MKVSIVTISFNQARYLARAINSVLSQDYPDIEYIVVDPGSTDGSRDIIESYGDRLAHILFAPDDGPADGLNAGFKLAGGQIFYYLNSDDALLPGAVQSAVNVLKEGGADIVSGNGLLVDGNGHVIRRMHSGRYSLWRAAYVQSVFMQQSTYFTSKIFREVEGFNKYNKVNWDSELMIRMVMAGGHVVRRRELWSLYTIHSESITGSAKLVDLQKREGMRLFEMIMGRPPTKKDKVTAQFARALRWGLDPRAAAERLVDKLWDPRKRYPTY